MLKYASQSMKQFHSVGKQMCSTTQEQEAQVSFATADDVKDVLFCKNTLQTNQSVILVLKC